MLDKLKSCKTRAYAALCALSLAVLVPSSAFAGDLSDAISTGITGANGILTDLAACIGLVVLIVLAVVGAKVVFGLLRKA